MFKIVPYNKIALQTGNSSAGCGAIAKRMVIMKENRKLMREIQKAFAASLQTAGRRI